MAPKRGKRAARKQKNDGEQATREKFYKQLSEQVEDIKETMTAKSEEIIESIKDVYSHAITSIPKNIRTMTIKEFLSAGYRFDDEVLMSLDNTFARPSTSSEVVDVSVKENVAPGKKKRKVKKKRPVVTTLSSQRLTRDTALYLSRNQVQTPLKSAPRKAPYSSRTQRITKVVDTSEDSCQIILGKGTVLNLDTATAIDDSMKEKLAHIWEKLHKLIKQS